MLNTFLVSFRLKNTYRVNTIIYSLKKLPIIKKLLPSSLYKNHALKVFANIVSALWEMISIFVGKFLYIPLMIMTPLSLLNITSQSAFLHILFFLTLVGAIFNTSLLAPSKDKYYAVILMKMDAKKFALSNYFYSLLGHLIGFFVAIVFFCYKSQFDFSIGLCLLIPFFVCSVKLFVMHYFLWSFQKGHRLHSENNQNRYTTLFAVICLLFAYGLLIMHIVLPFEVILTFMTLCIAFGFVSFVYVMKYKSYHRVYHTLLSSMVHLINVTSQQMVSDNYHKMITLDTHLTSEKEGFDFFNEIFVKRHKKILWKSTKRQSYIIIVVFIVIFIVLQLNQYIFHQVIDQFTKGLPYFVLIMYFLNTSNRVTQAMFMNCDHSMLTYSFYRQPQNILTLFKIRLKVLVKMNLIPAALIGLGVSCILLVNGGTAQILNCLISFISFISMSIFFSTHYMVLYYLLQPYNANTEMKNPLYSIISSLTYFLCYLFARIPLPAFVFGIATIFFCIVYCFVGCYLVYKKAMKTFKLCH